MHFLKFIKSILLLFVFTALWSCQERRESQWKEIAEKNISFVNIENISSKVEEMGAVIAIDTWLLDDSLLVCKSSQNAACIYRLDVKDWSLCDSLGMKGSGPGEFIYPHLILKSSGEYLIIDNGKRKSYLLSPESIQEISTANIGHLVTSPKMLEFPLVGYIEYHPNRTVWRIQNIETGVLHDSLCLVNEKGQDATLANDLSWDSNSENVVLAFLHKEQFAIGHRNSGELLSWHLFTRKGVIEKDKFYYSDVVCLDNSICLLSQKNVNMSDKLGYTEIEVYDYKGKPLNLIKLDFVANRMLFDVERNRILLLSPLDDLIHIVDYRQKVTN